MIEPETPSADLNDDANRPRTSWHLFRAVLDERADDMAFIAERVQKDAVTRLEKFINARSGGSTTPTRSPCCKVRQEVSVQWSNGAWTRRPSTSVS